MAAGLFLFMVAGPAGAVTKAQLQGRALSLANMPAGWTVDPVTGGGATASGCLHVLKQTAKHDVRVLVQYHNGNVPVLGEVLEAGSGAGGHFKSMASTLSKCRSITLTNSKTGQTLTGKIQAMSFPPVGTKSFAYAASVEVQGITVGLSVVGFFDRNIAAAVVLEDLDKPDTAMLQGFVTEAVNKIEGKAATPPPP